MQAEELKTERKDFIEKKTKELQGYTTDQLKELAKKSGIQLFTVVRERMIERIASGLAFREFHGAAFWVS